jgi:phosphatidylserine/phosphatidylglycerophosphate/cardiolipin synthase-like enzyme
VLATGAVADLKAPSGVHLLYRGPDAFLARLVLADAAERSIDAQYYIWHDDTTGRVLIAALLEAADRGVRVRLLIDDVGSAANDMNLLLLTRHANVEVRLFNPVASRSTRCSACCSISSGPTAGCTTVVHRRQPGRDRRRTQHRRRVFRRSGRRELR